MYVMWYLVFGAVGLLIAAIVGGFVFTRCRSEHEQPWYNQSWKYHFFDVLTTVCIAIIVVTALASIVLTAFAIGNPVVAKHEVQKYQYQYDMCEGLIEDGNLEQNVLIGSVAKDANIWLVNARADKARYGKWSMYYDCDLDSLKYIGER